MGHATLIGQSGASRQLLTDTSLQVCVCRGSCAVCRGACAVVRVCRASRVARRAFAGASMRGRWTVQHIMSIYCRATVHPQTSSDKTAGELRAELLWFDYFEVQLSPRSYSTVIPQLLTPLMAH